MSGDWAMWWWRRAGWRVFIFIVILSFIRGHARYYFVDKFLVCKGHSNHLVLLSPHDLSFSLNLFTPISCATCFISTQDPLLWESITSYFVKSGKSMGEEADPPTWYFYRETQLVYS